MNGWRKREGSQGGKQVGRESEENEGRWEDGTQELIKREEGGYRSRSSPSGDGCAHVCMGFVKCHI